MSEADAAHIVRQILSALGHMHARNICHRDLKPENLLFKDKGSMEIKLVDFGIAKQCPQGTFLTTPTGTPSYVAPEVVTEESKGYSTAGLVCAFCFRASVLVAARASIVAQKVRTLGWCTVISPRTEFCTGLCTNHIAMLPVICSDLNISFCRSYPQTNEQEADVWSLGVLMYILLSPPHFCVIISIPT